MNEVDIDGVLYVSEPETAGCVGCAGDSLFVPVCLKLPAGCSDDRIIWVRKD